jgi:predicted dinucleotide-binding enzyme
VTTSGGGAGVTVGTGTAGTACTDSLAAAGAEACCSSGSRSNALRRLSTIAVPAMPRMSTIGINAASTR